MNNNGNDLNEQEKRSSGAGDWLPAIGIALREFLSDILGAFLPGIYFTGGLLCSLALFAGTIFGDKFSCFFSKSNDDVLLIALVEQIHWIIPLFVFGLCVFSYIMGSVFYRKEINEPDRESAARTYNKAKDGEKEGLAFSLVKPLSPSKNPIKRLLAWRRGRIKVTAKDVDVDFPYLHLKRYLTRRKYAHLVKFIPWNGDDEATFKQRSKMFINILKMRIHRYMPSEMPEIVKNEAHARLNNSLWFAAKSMMRISWVALVFSPIGMVMSIFSMENHPLKILSGLFSNPVYPSVLAALSVFHILVASYIRRSIKQYFHYLRVREIVFVLETAYTAAQEYPAIFDGLEDIPFPLENFTFQGNGIVKPNSNIIRQAAPSTARDTTQGAKMTSNEVNRNIKTLILWIDKIDKDKSICNGPLLKIKTGGKEIPPDNVLVTVDGGFIPAVEGQVEYTLPDGFNGDLCIEFADRNFNNLEISVFCRMKRGAH